MNISDEAVEAAWQAIPEDAYVDNLSREHVRVMLQAAAPHLIKAWINDTSRLPRDLPGYGPEGHVRG